MLLRAYILTALLAGVTQGFQCSPDTILRMATDKRTKQLEKECHEQKTGQETCATKEDVEKAWKEFETVSVEYKEHVAKCRAYVAEKSGIKGKRDLEDQEIGMGVRRHHDHVGRHQHNEDHKKREHEDRDHHRVKRSADHDPTDPNIDHTGHNHRRRRNPDHDPNDPNVDHTGHNHKRRHAGADHDPTDPNIDHTGHNHKRRSLNADHDPTDPNIDHTGHNHKRRSLNADHDPTDPNIDHTGHNHRRRSLNAGHDPTDPNIDHTGHNHRHRRHRSRRQTCSLVGQEKLTQMSNNFTKHCERENICLPMEDLPAGAQQDKFNEIHKLRAKKYSAYLTELFKCHGKI